MKKLIAIVLCVLMAASVLTIAASADSFNAQGHWDLNRVGKIVVKKADPANVVKDGNIGENEYERFYPDLDPDTSFLHLYYEGGESFENAESMLASMEYYFSWDEVHGFNFAVRNTPKVLHQTLSAGEGEKPGDPFAWDLSYVINAETQRKQEGFYDEHNFALYYALAKRTDTGEYLEGHYQQFGYTGQYDPEPGVDYVITYTDTTSMIEWSIPFENTYPGAGAGSTIRMSISAQAGNTDDPDDRSTSYGISLGDYGFGVNAKDQDAGNQAEFELSADMIGEEPYENPFTDVKDKAYYADAVKWAVQNGVTKGMTDTTFCPNDECTRGHVVTFLWRAAGSPEPTVTTCDFTDVSAKGFYYKAMLWAVEKGITNGMTPTTFGPGEKCNRGQVVTFLWRAKGMPPAIPSTGSSDKMQFTDVSAKGFYYKAMLWAVSTGVAKGMSDTSFAPTAICNRAQVATFLYRAFFFKSVETVS